MAPRGAGGADRELGAGRLTELRIALPVAAVLFAVFAVIAINQVQDRRQLDRDIDASFSERLTETAGARALVPDDACRRPERYVYVCRAHTRLRSGASPAVAYDLEYTDDGCWSAELRSRDVARRLPVRLTECLGR